MAGSRRRCSCSDLLDLERQALQQVWLVLSLPQLPELGLEPVLQVQAQMHRKGDACYACRHASHMQRMPLQLAHAHAGECKGEVLPERTPWG